ncbi:L-rhamnose mutarotase [Algoriphagus locisalis]|uniref:L-rhamnose mutarotase n=1 Tax=Algoriphagus locisalis TaxID=305507 RepID=A0A1I6YJ91_9BACT|nr:L-rhamnose mutarotase [Algoriphagus locisalis]SFT50589.1 L-rhamnose mutarotase [Algoriphagus locisalis]
MPQKLAFRMKLIPGFEEEYERRHREIWPELVTLLKNTGIIDYQIFLDRETSFLFAYQLIEGETNSQDLGSTEIVQRWWKYMADIMETNPDNSPVSVELPNVFDLQ